MAPFAQTARKLGALWPRVQAGDARAVHAARKLTRRAQAQLRIADAPRRTERAWRDLRRALGGVRDRDASGVRLHADLRALGLGRSERDAFGRDWTAARAAHIGDMVLPALPPAVERPGHWKARVRKVLRRDARKLLREAQDVLDTDDLKAWHTWRKHLKRYRYTAELLHEPPPALIRVLDALGHMQDAAVVQALVRTERWLPEYADRLLHREDGARVDAQARVRALWPALERHLRTQAD